MCRLPEDIMRRIISLVKQPLPTADRSNVSWEHLNQKGLFTMMRVSRMTYSIAAPLLYKEVVVNNLASFFLGVDDHVKEHHQGCISHSTAQTRLCHLVKRKDGTSYDCPRHSPPGSDQLDHPPTPTSFASYHKQELLAMVEAIHVVYASADKYIYNGVDIDQDTAGPISESLLPGICDTGRYKNYPICVESFPMKDSPLVKLQRMTIGRWMGDYWNTHSFVSDWRENWDEFEDPWMALARFEGVLGMDMPQLGPRFVCRYQTLGPLRRYPDMLCETDVNVLHDPDLDMYGYNLMVGAVNLVHINSRHVHPAETVFFEEVATIAAGLVQAFEDWNEYLDADDLASTLVVFTIDRDFPVTEAAEDRKSADLLLSMSTVLRGTLLDLLNPDMDLEDKWHITWADQEGDCPACQPETCHSAYKIDRTDNKVDNDVQLDDNLG